MSSEFNADLLFRKPSANMASPAMLVVGSLALRLPGSKTPVALYTSRLCVAHHPGDGHPEQPARLSTLLRALQEEWVPRFGNSLHVCEPRTDVRELPRLAPSISLPASIAASPPHAPLRLRVYR